ncbi:MAG: signal recognition particle-docking protein FtsY [Calditrichaeota bacterium]|nr:signal recognition particle-docking protein FtsY [Candidatus Cloacimonadota bacterium]MCB1046384.1 signal recognition particle-docking protein FtsY [Calditrichota bacterium]MCB9473422.1 signal recognition particle-docking protein FtsY [Candidatus Delongbacteria bacterium]
MSLLGKFSRALSRTRENLGGRIRQLVGLGRVIDRAMLEELEEILLAADLGVDTTEAVIQRLREVARNDADTPLVQLIEAQILAEMNAGASTLALPADEGLRVVLVVGVNGAGKTTTIGKLAHRWGQEGRKVLIAAADTFRAAAIEQLETWARRSGAQFVSSVPGADPASVAFDGLSAARARGCDTLLVDTAGRLQNKRNLMQELEKMSRVLSRQLPGAPHEVLLVLDGTTGQNALSQARLFTDATGVNGLVITKLDGTARGGIALAIHRELGIPVRWVGVGEGLDDLQPFDAGAYARALFEELELDA